MSAAEVCTVYRWAELSMDVGSVSAGIHHMLVSAWFLVPFVSPASLSIFCLVLAIVLVGC